MGASEQYRDRVSKLAAGKGQDDPFAEAEVVEPEVEETEDDEDD